MMEKKTQTIAKIIKWSDFNKIKSSIKEKKTVLVGGCFDILHFGHLFFLEKAKRLGDFLIVALEPDEFMKNKKGRFPIHTQKQRAQALSYLEMVDLVVMLPFFKSDDSYFALVKKINPRFIAVTAGDEQIGNKKKQARSVGAKLVTVSSRLKKFASSKIFENYAPFSSD